MIRGGTTLYRGTVLWIYEPFGDGIIYEPCGDNAIYEPYTGDPGIYDLCRDNTIYGDNNMDI